MRCLSWLTAMAALVLPVTPASARDIETVLQDDAVLLHPSSPQKLREDLRTIKGLGVTRVRITANWIEIAPHGRSKTRPRFDATDPADYALDRWHNLDRAVINATAAGLKVMIDIGFFAPLWASADPAGSERGVRDVDVKELALFSRAVATRYSGSFDAGYGTLPAVGVFAIWNEPNHPGFRQPQFSGGVAVAADWYRAAVLAAYPQIKQAAPDALVLIGNLAPGGDDTGANRNAVTPVTFLQRMACTDRKFRPLPRTDCKLPRKIPGDGLAYHPYHLRWMPDRSAGRKGWVTMHNLPHLTGALRKLKARGRVASAVANNVWLTEFGYETNDQVPNKPFSAADQALLLPWTERRAWRLPQVRSIAQFLLRDVETQAAVDLAVSGSDRRAPGSWQSGLYLEDGTAKPAADRFRVAVDAQRVRRTVRLWAHLRAEPDVRAVRFEVSRDGVTFRDARVTVRLSGRHATGVWSGDGRGTFWRVSWQRFTSDEWLTGPTIVTHR